MPRVVLIVPIPGKDRHDRPLSQARRRAAQTRLLKRFGAWFGSATLLPSWGSWKSTPSAPLSIDRRQTALLVATEASVYRKRRPSLERLLNRVGRDLRQAEMAVIAFQPAKGSLLIRCGAGIESKSR